MTTPTKARTSIWSAQTLTAGAGDISSAVVDLSATFESQIDIKLTNGATGPTVAAQVLVKAANNYNGGSPTLPIDYGGALTGLTTNNGVAYFTVTIPIGIAAIQLVAGSNTGTNVTVDADISNVTGIA